MTVTLIRTDILRLNASTQTPAYVTNITDPEVLKQTLRTHVEAVAGRYKDDWAYLDVINERKSMVHLPNWKVRGKADLATLQNPLLALFENGTFRDSVWYNLLGEDYLEFAVSFWPPPICAQKTAESVQ
jgi:endo-1,4-beta-xylanase